MKYINKLEITNFDYAKENIMNNWERFVKDRDRLKQIMKHCTINLFLENITRLHSMQLCMLGDTYTQQSQRYVRFGEGINGDLDTLFGIEFIRVMDEEDKEPISKYIKYCISNYQRAIKAGENPEDARGELPILARTNLVVTITGEKIVDFLDLLKTNLFYPIAQDFVMEATSKMGSGLFEYYIFNDNDSLDNERRFSRGNFEFKFAEDINLFNFTDENVTTNNMNYYIGMGAATSRFKKQPSEYDYDGNKIDKIIENVLGYNHNSILEHGTVTIHKATMSIAAFHQFIRHRHQSITMHGYVIANGDELIDDVLMNTYFSDKDILFRNRDLVEFTTTMSIRELIAIAQERTCHHAQSEIRAFVTRLIEYMVSKYGKLLFANAAPRCVTGKCMEGKNTCKHMREVKERFKFLTDNVEYNKDVNISNITHKHKFKCIPLDMKSEILSHCITINFNIENVVDNTCALLSCIFEKINAHEGEVNLCRVIVRNQNEFKELSDFIKSMDIYNLNEALYQLNIVYKPSKGETINIENNEFEHYKCDTVDCTDYTKYTNILVLPHNIVRDEDIKKYIDEAKNYTKSTVYTIFKDADEPTEMYKNSIFDRLISTYVILKNSNLDIKDQLVVHIPNAEYLKMFKERCETYKGALPFKSISLR